MSGSQFITFSYGLSVALCVLMVTALMRGSRVNGTTLPSFVGMTTLASLSFCMACLFASLAIRYYESDGQFMFALFLAGPLALGFCLLMSALAFLIVRVIPSLGRVIVSEADKGVRTRVISIAALCTGLVLAYMAFILG